MSDTMLPIIAAVMVIMGFVGGCDRFRLSCLEDDNREYRKRILKLETDVMFLEKRMKRIEVAK